MPESNSHFRMIHPLKLLPLPMCRAAPDPFKRSDGVDAHPEMTEEDLKNPDASYHIVEFVTLELIEHAEGKAAEDDCADDALHEVVGKGHATDRTHQLAQPRGERHSE